MLGSWVRAPSRSPQNLRESRPESGFRCFSAVCVFQSYANYLKILLFTQQNLLFSSPVPSPADKIPSPRGTESAILTNFLRITDMTTLKYSFVLKDPKAEKSLVFLIVHHHGKRLKISTGLVVLSDCWDADNYQLTRKSDYFRQDNATLWGRRT